jgi:hypothetical protein
MSMKVAKKIIEVMNKVSYLKKDGNVNFNTTKYGYLSEEKITQAISKARAEVGLAILPIDIVEEYETGKRSRVVVTYLFIDADSGETLTAKMGGHGVDTQDKALNKALTQAFKYLQRQTFGIATGDDPDKISSAELDELERQQAEKDRLEKEKERQNLYKSSVNLYKQLKGSEEGFEDFYNKLKSENYTDQAINDFFNVKLQERKQTTM